MSDVDNYINDMLASGSISAGTAVSYKTDLDAFCSYLEHRKKTLQRAAKSDIMRYIDLLRDSGLSDATVARRLSAIKSLYGYLHSEKNYPTDVAAACKSGKYFRKSPDYLTRAEMDKLLAAPDAKDITGLRDRTILELLYASGIKASELIAADLSSVNTQLGYINVKGAKAERVVPVHDTACSYIRAYLKMSRPLLVRDESETALFVNIDGARLTRQGLWKILKKYANAAGIKKDVTVQTMRHSFAAHLIENGADLHSVQLLLGHSSFSTTQSYSYNLNINKQLEVYKKYHPEAASKKKRKR